MPVYLGRVAADFGLCDEPVALMGAMLAAATFIQFIGAGADALFHIVYYFDSMSIGGDDACGAAVFLLRGVVFFSPVAEVLFARAMVQ